MAADIDVRSFATFASVPETTVHTVLDNPTAELVKSLLQNIEKKIKDYEHLKSQNTRLEVELETVVRTNESKSKVLQNSRDRALAEASKLRDDLQASESKRAQLQSDHEQLKQSIESETSEATTLRNKIQSLEASHRDTLSLLDSKSKDVDRLAQDLSAEHDKLVSMRRQISELEQAKQAASSAATTAKFKQTSLEQELELQRKNIDWYETERKQKAEEHQKFRKDKNARLSELQQSLEQRIEELDSLRRTENSLRAQLEDQVQRNESLSSQIEKLNEEKITDADHHRQEVDGLTRLVELQKVTAETAKTRVEELTASLDETREDAAEEVGRIRAECQEEHNEREAAEHRIAELETRISDLEAELHQAHSRPSTPRQDTNGQPPSTPIRSGTPLRSFTPSSTHRLKNGLTTTQMYSEYTKLEKELAVMRSERNQLQTYVDEMVSQLEAVKPERDEAIANRLRVEDELVQQAQTIQQTNEEKANALKENRSLRAQLEQKGRENEANQQMARDLSSQVRRLILEQQAGSLSDIEYERLLSDLQQINERDMDHLSEPQRQVNQYLLAFRNIAELQEVNQRQAGTIRNLLSQVESAQAQETQQKCEQLEKDLDEANTKISSYQEEINRLVAQTKSFVKERDMFRSMLTRRGQIDPSDFSRSMPLPAGGFSASVGGDRVSPALESDLSKVLKELQAQYDNYRREVSTDTASLRNQLSELSSRNSQLQTEASRSLGQLSAATQRYEMLQSNYTVLKNDNAELQKRYNNTMESATRQELRTQQAAEDLVEARGIVDGLRRESANLKAEKDLWKTVEHRLLADNESLRNERSRLDQLNANLQNLLNEKEHSDNESRRRLQSQVDNLEAELQTSKRKLAEEIEDRNQTALRRNYEHEQNQKRVDDLMSSLSATREELAAAKTSRDHLQARVDELTVELRSAEERLEVFTRPPTTPGLNINGTSTTDVSREQELAMEVSELKRDLDLKSTELTKAEEHIEEYKGIAQEAEERLQQFVETNDEDKADLQASINEKDKTIKDLQQRIDDTSAELSNTNVELSKLRDEQAVSGRNLEEQKAILQSEIDRLKLAEEKASEQASLYLEASRAQQQIAEERQQNYETELLKHTEAVKSAQAARAEANEARLQLAEARSQADIAKTDLDQKESSWLEKEARYKQELDDLKNRREEVEKHNKSLHDTLETLTSQLASLQRDKPAPTEDEADENRVDQNQDYNGMQEVVRHLRQEKEIVEVRLHMNTLELDRTKRQLESKQTELEALRLKLDQEQRAAMNSDLAAMSNNKLVETVNELNLYRESSATLRAEKNQAQQALTERTKRVEELEAEIIPLRSRITELEHNLELQQGEMELLQKDRDSWQQRTQNILSKYDRVDPAELEELKNRATQLESERDEAVVARTTLQTQVDGIPEAVESAKKDLKDRLQEQFKTAVRKAREEKAQLSAELNTVKEQLETANATLSEQTAQATESSAQQGEASESALAAATQRVTELETRVEELEALVSEKDTQIASTPSREETKAKEEQLKNRLNARLSEVKKEAEEAKQRALSELRESLIAEHQVALEKIKADTQDGSKGEQAETQAVPEEPKETSGENEPVPFERILLQIDLDVARRLIKESQPLSDIVKENIRRRVSEARTAMQKEIAAANPTASSEEVDKKVNELEEQFRAEKEAIISQKDDELTAERQNLREELQNEFETQKQAILEDQQRKTADEVAKAKASTEKMLSMKLNMLQKASATNLAKINVVKKAAEETPEKPVKEVWEVAKVAKVPVEATRPAPTPATPTKPSISASAPAPSTNDDDAKPEAASQTNGTSSPAPETEAKDTESSGEASKEVPAPTPAPVQQQTRASGLPQPASQLPRGTFSGRGRGNAPAGRGTGIPRPGSAAGNHSVQNIRGRGGARGGHNPSSPSRGNLNPAAQQFTPQNKRPREEGEDAGNQGKRIRGGGAGS